MAFSCFSVWHASPHPSLQQAFCGMPPWTSQPFGVTCVLKNCEPHDLAFPFLTRATRGLWGTESHARRVFLGKASGIREPESKQRQKTQTENTQRENTDRKHRQKTHREKTQTENTQTENGNTQTENTERNTDRSTTQYYKVLHYTIPYYTAPHATTLYYKKYYAALHVRAGNRAQDLLLPRLTPYPRGKFSGTTIFKRLWQQKQHSPQVSMHLPRSCNSKWPCRCTH